MSSLPSNFTILKEHLELKKAELEFLQFGLTSLKKPVSFNIYKDWIENSQYGEMNYLKDHANLKENHKLIDESLQTALTFSFRYFPISHSHQKNIPARVALYAQNSDYHFWVKDKLNVLTTELKKIFPHETFIPFVDSGPVLERDLAHQSGLGWFGKNSCLINQKQGSLFFLAEILTSVKLSPNNEADFPTLTHPDLCGKCTKCLDICPTQAILPNKTLEAKKCISYLTIEAKSIAEKNIRSAIGDWFFGCDLCQTVCPWNQKQFKLMNVNNSHLTSTEKKLTLSNKERSELIEFYRFILTSSHKQLQKYFSGTALLRTHPKNLKRNALIVIANQKLSELKAEVETLKPYDDTFSELIQWCLEEMN